MRGRKKSKKATTKNESETPASAQPVSMRNTLSGK